VAAALGWSTSAASLATKADHSAALLAEPTFVLLNKKDSCGS
jgi:hypothetical protein